MQDLNNREFTPLNSYPIPSDSTPPIRELPYKVAPWSHQRTAILRAARLKDFALFFEMGTGKTMTAINILRYKYTAADRALPTLVLGPPIVLENWRREFLMHSKRTPGELVILDGSGKDREKKLTRALAAMPAPVVITNYETLLMENVFQILYSWSPACVVFDESHRLKDMKAKRTKRSIMLADRAQHRYLLTGTPVLKNALDLFSQFRILDGGDTFGQNYFVFRARYFYDRNANMPKAKYFPDWRITPGAVEEINRKIKAKSMNVKKAECLDLPPFVRQTVFVELSAPQKKLYDEMKQDFITFINDRACVAQIALTKALRLQQIVSGFAAVRDTETGEQTNVSIKDNPRAAALESLLEDLAGEHKVIVWAVFKQNYETIRQVCSRLNLRYVEIHGEVTPTDKQKAMDTFNTDPECRVLLGHPGSGGIGVNLVAADYAIFYSRSFSLEHDLQAEARNYRGGSERHEKITRIDIVATGTIDEIVLKALAAKQEIGDKLLRDLQQEI